MATRLFGSSVIASLVLTACTRQDQSSNATTSLHTGPTSAPAALLETSQKSASRAAAELQSQAVAGQNRVENSRNGAVESVDSIKPQDVSATAPALLRDVESRFDEAKSLVAQQKYAEALTSVSKLSNLTLSTEQERALEELKAKIQSGLAGHKANKSWKSVDGVLPGNK